MVLKITDECPKITQGRIVNVCDDKGLRQVLVLWYSLARQCKSRASGKLGKASGPIILLGDTLLICQCPNKAQPYGI